MTAVNYDKLRDNLIYTIKESQIKIGYTPNAVRLNYPVDSLNRLLGTNCSTAEMREVLEGFCVYAADTLGKISVGMFEGRFCITVPAEGVAFVHENVRDSGFLTELIGLFREHHHSMTMEDILRVFRKYSDAVVCRESDNDEFNYVVYFENGEPDDFVYCIELLFGHASDHRLTKEDFAALTES